MDHQCSIKVEDRGAQASTTIRGGRSHRERREASAVRGLLPAKLRERLVELRVL